MEHWWNIPFFPAVDLPSPPTDPNPGKKHAACDECRSRKLKCTSETTGCARCQRDGIQCYYSSQKPMGRPRRKKEDQHTAPSTPPLNSYYNASNSDNSAAIPSKNSDYFSAPAQEKTQNQVCITPDVSNSGSSPSGTNSTSPRYESTSCDPPNGGPCVYGDPAMLIADIRYNLVPLDILLPKQHHLA